MKAFLKALYHGQGQEYNQLRWAMVFIDVMILAFFLATTFVEHNPIPTWLVISDFLIGIYLLFHWLGRVWVTENRIAHLSRPLVLVDLLIIISLFAPALTESFVFLRVLRTLQLMRSYHLLASLSKESSFFRRREGIINAALNLVVFVFVVSALVYALQVRVNDGINNYVDALYFTVTTLTTTGFGDITLLGNSGRLLAVFVMVVGVSLFLRLIHAIFRAHKVILECPDCGLNRHDQDAVHCKHCGRTLHIDTEGS